MTQGSFASPNITSCQLIPFPLSTSVRPHPQHTLSRILMASRSSDLTHCVYPPPSLSLFFLLHISLSFTSRPPLQTAHMHADAPVHAHTLSTNAEACFNELSPLSPHTHTYTEYTLVCTQSTEGHWVYWWGGARDHRAHYI